MSPEVPYGAVSPRATVVFARVSTYVFLICVRIGALDRYRSVRRIVRHRIVMSRMNPHVNFIRTDRVIYVSDNNDNKQQKFISVSSSHSLVLTFEQIFPPADHER